MKSLIKVCFISLCSLISVSSAYAVTAVGDYSSAANAAANKADVRYLNGSLKGRYENGRLDTSVGEYQIEAGTKVDDQRPAAKWFKIPAKANIQLELKKDRLIRAIIY